jgi:hypothetical protein
MKIDFNKILTNEICTLTLHFDNNYSVDIFPNMDSYTYDKEERKEIPYRYDVSVLGKEGKELYTLMGFKLIPINRLYDISQEQVEDVCDDIKLFSPYVRDDINIANNHISQSEIEIIVVNAIDNIKKRLNKG